MTQLSASTSNPTKAWPCLVVAAPGLEALVLDELRDLGLTGREVLGGVEVEAPLVTVGPLLRRVRCASRWLVRVAEGPVGDPKEVERLLDRLPWDLLPARPRVALRLSAHKAPPERIRWVQAELVRALLLRLGPHAVSTQAPTGEKDEVAVAARLDGRRCTLSLDAGGSPLHLRGYRLEAGPAPLRETVAAAVLRAAGFRGEGLVWDPMCGSGTLAIEAALWGRPLAPHLRRFSIEDWRLPAVELQTPRVPEPTVLAGDLDAQVLERARRNAERAEVQGLIRFENKELAEWDLPDVRPAVVVVNPPWGRRLGGRNAARRLAERLGAVLARQCRGWRAGVLLPERELVKALPLLQGQVVQIDNGGAPIWLATGEVTGARWGVRL